MQGCYNDVDSDRAIPLLEGQSLYLYGDHGSREEAILKCYKAANAKGYTFFAVQDGGLCLSSSDAESTFKRYGASTHCDSNGKGGDLANNVYEIKGIIIAV